MIRSAPRRLFLLTISAFCLTSACAVRPAQSVSGASKPAVVVVTSTPRIAVSSAVVRKVLENARKQTRITHSYDPAYVSIAYPNGDVPPTTGVCADVIVRAFRAGKIDLQKTVHEDMKANFSAYPKLWGLKRPDPNIDHRRVANLMTYFKRRKQSLPPTQNPSSYLPGDVVAWELPGGRLHIGLVSDEFVLGTRRPQMMHNIGAGTQLEDVLFAFKIIGHYRAFR
jgi:uncharacterized protein YijF (DUF1287 family)